jgi:hypothetical protein
VYAQPILLQARPPLCFDDLARERLNNPSGIVLREIEKAITEDDPETGLPIAFEEVQTVREATQLMLAQAMPERGSSQTVINTIGASFRLGLAPKRKSFSNNGLDLCNP